jgi:hypothetical protein
MPHCFPCRLICVLPAVVLMLLSPVARAQATYEHEPINYLSAPVSDPVAQLQKRVDAGTAKLEFDKANGYLASLLKELKVPVSSQGLVFSKTSFQRDRISPSNPRALYFNDDTYVGYVPGGDVIELASTDPNLGTVFYTLDQRKRDCAAPTFVRQTYNCLQCHASGQTRDVPGLMIRSIYPDSSGQPLLSAGTFVTTQQSPLSERWGGWYVTGQHGRQRHMGNVTVIAAAVDASPAKLLDTEAGANLADLSGKFDTSAYLTGGSDVAALMVFAHQAQMHNLLTRANYQTRLALRDEAAMNQSLGRPADQHSETTLARIKDAGDPLVRYMLFCDEAALGKLEGCDQFQNQFEAAGPRDAKGRSLRELDLKRRVFKYPCSYLIYSAQFDALPDAVKDYVYRRLWEVLSGADTSGDFSHLNATTRRAIVEILRDTKKGLPDCWR